MDHQLSDDYCHQQRMARLDQVQKELLVLQETMRNTSSEFSDFLVEIVDMLSY